MLHLPVLVRPCRGRASSHMSVNVRSTPFQNQFIPHDDIGEQAMMPEGLLD